jgi:hypothetical protein
MLLSDARLESVSNQNGQTYVQAVYTSNLGECMTNLTWNKLSGYSKSSLPADDVHSNRIMYINVCDCFANMGYS